MNVYSKDSEFKEVDMVTHPPHYNREGAMESIDEMKMVFGNDAVYWFCILNAWKYRYRAGDKGDALQDKQKSDWYMNKANEIKQSLISDNN